MTTHVPGGSIAIVLLLVLTMSGAACDDDSPTTTASEQGASSDVSITTDQQLTDRLRAISETGAASRLRGLTDFDWDAVHVFAEGATRDAIEALAGAPVLRDTRYYDAGNLLVFTLGGAVVRAISVVPDLLRVDHTTWDGDVRLEPVGDATPAILRLVGG